MQFSRARYVTLCQQSLVTAAVLVVGISAAGVKTLDIVPRPSQLAERTGAESAVLPGGSAVQRTPDPEAARAPAVSAPVTPKVREVKVAGIAPSARREAGAHPPAARQAPATEAPTTRTRTKPAPAQRLVAMSTPQPVSGYATVGVTWASGVTYGDDQISVQVRTERDGTWSDWAPAEYHDDHGADGAEGQAAGQRSGTDALVVGDVDKVQMRAQTFDGSTPPDLRLAVIDPGKGKLVEQAPAIDTAKLAPPAGSPAAVEAAEQASLSAATFGADPAPADPVDPGATDPVDPNAPDVTAALSGMKVAPKPYIYSRAQWGANEKMRDQSSPSYGTIKAGFIHHTVNANNYTADQVPALLRGIYAYHTQSRGWRDVGYNFLVDRFGRIWEGRWGGVTRPVVGAHTLGYNEVAFAMSAIGNFDIATPPQAVADAYARLFAWKLSMYNIRADASRIYVKNRYMQAINGHRDAGQTACPGRYLYAKLPGIRVAAQKIQNAAQSGTTTPPPTPPPSPAPAPDPNKFTSPTQSPRPATSQPSGIEFPRTQNLVGDGNPDLVLQTASGEVRVVPTGRQTGFVAGGTTSGNWASMSLVAAVGDVTGDGRGDVLARLGRDRITRVYAGDGTGGFSRKGIAATRKFQWANMLMAAGDWNGDRRNDVIMRDTASGKLWMFPGAGAGRFGNPTLLSASWKGFELTTVVRDVSGDGRPDLVGIHGNGYVYVALSTSTGAISGFQRRQRVGDDYDALVGGAGDLGGDSYGDVVVRSTKTGMLSILTGSRGGYFGDALGPFPGAEELSQLSGAQVTGSSQPDLVGVSKAGTALVTVAHNGQANLGSALPGNLARTDITQVLNVGDWNGDGRGDVITRQTKGDSLVLRPGQGNGKFGNGVVMSRGWASFTNLAAVGDVTGDNRPDLVGRAAGGKTTIFPGDGARGFTAPVEAPSFLTTFNQIGKGSWKPQYLPGSAYIGSDGAFVPFMGTGAGDLAGYDWVIGTGDVNGDESNDLVARDAEGRLWLLPGTDTGYAERRLMATGFGGYRLAG